MPCHCILVIAPWTYTVLSYMAFISRLFPTSLIYSTKSLAMLAVVLLACNPNTWEAEAERS